MSTSKPIEPTALVYDGCSAEQFLAFDRQVKRWLRRKFKGLTKYFWDGEAPTVTEENFKEICEAIYGSLLKTAAQLETPCTPCCLPRQAARENYPGGPEP